MKFECLVLLADEEMMGRSWFAWVRLSIRCRTPSEVRQIMNGKSIRSKTCPLPGSFANNFLSRWAECGGPLSKGIDKTHDTEIARWRKPQRG
jgi:hypothetical protein